MYVQDESGLPYIDYLLYIKKEARGQFDYSKLNKNIQCDVVKYNAMFPKTVCYVGT